MDAHGRKQSNRRWLRRSVIPLLAMALLAVSIPTSTQAWYGHGHRGLYRPYYGGFYGHFGRFGFSHHGYYGYYGGYGYGPGYGYGNPTRAALYYAKLGGLGALDLNVRPKKAEVYVDGRYIGVTGQLDGTPDYLWLEEGTHELVFFKDGFGTVVRELTLQAGQLIRLKFRLEPGESVRPEGVAEELAES